MKRIIIGHKNPDTDSIVASLIAENYYRNVLKADVRACRAGDLNNESKFVLKSFNLNAPLLVKSLKGNESVILVDHNEKSQIVDGLQFSQVEGIIDHHKVAIETEKPLFIRMEPIGSTSSVLAKMYKESGKKIPPIIAKLMLAGILSDTLHLTSPTTTEYDKKLVAELNKISKLNIKEFVSEMFAAKSSLKGISLEDVITLDYKNFEMGKSKVGIGTWETTNPETVNEKKEEILKMLKVRKEKAGLDYIYFMVVDILKQDCFLYLIGEEEKSLAEKVFKVKSSVNQLILKGVVSRKKQIVPPLTEELSK